MRELGQMSRQRVSVLYSPALHSLSQARKAFTGVACIALAITMAGCSSGGSASSATPTAANTAASGQSDGTQGGAAQSSATQKSFTAVKIGKAVDTIGFTTADIAQAQGYFAKEGVNATDEVLGGSSTAFAALQSGGVQFVLASSTALMKAKAQGLPLQAVAALDHGVSLQLLVSNDWVKAHSISASQPLDTVMKAMAGAKLGEISTTDFDFFHYLMQAANVDPSKFTFINIKTQAAALAAIQHGEIDAFLLSPPSTYFAQSQGDAQIVATLHEVPQLANMAYDILVVDADYAKKNPGVVKSVATAFAMADNVMATNPASIINVETKHYKRMSSDVLLQSIKYVTFTKDGTMTADRWNNAKQEALQTGEKVSSLDVSSSDNSVWTNQYIDISALS